MEEVKNDESTFESVRAFDLLIEVAHLSKMRLEDILKEYDLTYTDWRLLHYLAHKDLKMWTGIGEELFIKSDMLYGEAKDLERRGLLSIAEKHLTMEGKILYNQVSQKFIHLAKSFLQFQEDWQKQLLERALNRIKQLIV